MSLPVDQTLLTNLIVMLLSYIYLISIIFIAIKTEKIRQKALAPALEDNWIIVEADRAMDQIQEEIRRNII